MPNVVLLYYKYAAVPNPDAERISQLKLCRRLELKGRILIGEEGINGTVAGSKEATDAYMAAMEGHPIFKGVEFKIDAHNTVPFPRLRVRVRPEIVTLGVAADPADGAPKLSPAEFNEKIKDPNVVIFDARNNYESAIGKFRGAITPNIGLFKELPAALREYEDLKDKTVVTYCTGGIRCEKASALLKQAGFKDVYQLDGGIIKYAQAYPKGAFEGECFVFDERMSVAFQDNPQLLGACHFCAGPTNHYTNCDYAPCNRLMLVCAECIFQTQCSNKCRQNAKTKAQPFISKGV